MILKDIIIIRGMNHYPQDIENSVQDSHPALRRIPSSAEWVGGGPLTVLPLDGDDIAFLQYT